MEGNVVTDYSKIEEKVFNSTDDLLFENVKTGDVQHRKIGEVTINSVRLVLDKEKYHIMSTFCGKSLRVVSNYDKFYGN